MPVPRLRTVLRLILIGTLALLLVLAAGVGYFLTAFPRVTTPRTVQVARTPERLARGEYLSRHVAGCVGCHGQRDWSKYSAPLLRGTEGRGGTVFNLAPDMRLFSTNITPSGVGSWTDGELIRAITEGVSRDGHALFPLMPYENYGKMATADVEAIVAYIRTLAPISHEPVPARELPFPLSVIVRTMPKAATPPATPPDRSDRIAAGKYLTTIASCGHCHTPHDGQGQALPGMEFAGGEVFKLPNGYVQHSANITPDRETGIGNWSERDFVERFKTWGEMDAEALTLGQGPNTDMPWRDFGGMTRDDLALIYAYLRTLPAVRHAVPKP